MTMQQDMTLFAQRYKQDEESDFQRYWRILRYRKWKVALFVIAVTGLTILYVSNQVPIYRASTTVLIEGQETKVLSIEEVYGLNTKDQEYYTTQFEILKSRELAERVVKHLGLETNPLFDPDQQTHPVKNLLAGVLGDPGEVAVVLTPEQHFDMVVDNFASNLSISPIRNTQLVKINFELADPALAATITDTLARQYIQRNLEDRMGVTDKATGWLSERLEDLRSTLQASEQKLQSYREEANLVDVKGVQTLGADEIQEITQRYVEARKQRSQAETVYSQIRALGPDASPVQLMSIQSILGHELVRSFKQDKAQADAKVSELSHRYGPKHPKMISAMSDANAADALLYQQIISVAQGIETNYKAALQTEQALERQLSQAKVSLQDVNRKEIRLRELEREVDTNRKLFNMFLTRAKETEEARGLQNALARIVDPAFVPNEPVKPNKVLAVIVMFFASSLVAGGIAFFVDSMKNTVRTGDDVERKLGSSLLGYLPLVKRPKSETTFEGYVSNQDGHFAEAVRSVRTAFVLSNMDQSCKVALVTSSVPKEGKSTVTLNLAESLASMESVLVIDGDLRRPSLTKAFGLEPGAPGLAELIAGTHGIKDCVHKIKGTSLQAIPAGNLNGVNPLEIISSKRLAKLLDQLGQHYDRVIVDTPPVHAVSDAFILATYADVVLYVVKSDSTAAPVAANGIKKLRAVGAKVSGVVLNQVDVQKAVSYSADSADYFSDYGYGESKAAT